MRSHFSRFRICFKHAIQACLKQLFRRKLWALSAVLILAAPALAEAEPAPQTLFTNVNIFGQYLRR